jgi:hypothetical protein
VKRLETKQRIDSPDKTHPFSPLLCREKAFIRESAHAQWEKNGKSPQKAATSAKLTRHYQLSMLDDFTAPGRGTGPTYLLTQLRTGHCWLSTYAKAFRFQDNDRCVCSNRETLSHVLWDCPKPRVLRRKLKERVGDAFGSVACLLGASPGVGRGKPISIVLHCGSYHR